MNGNMIQVLEHTGSETPYADLGVNGDHVRALKQRPFFFFLNKVKNVSVSDPLAFRECSVRNINIAYYREETCE